jgi:hypothetical protein
MPVLVQLAGPPGAFHELLESLRGVISSRGRTLARYMLAVATSDVARQFACMPSASMQLCRKHHAELQEAPGSI